MVLSVGGGWDSRVVALDQRPESLAPMGPRHQDLLGLVTPGNHGESGINRLVGSISQGTYQYWRQGSPWWRAITGQLVPWNQGVMAPALPWILRPRATKVDRFLGN